ncbi:MAG: AAA family ATPase [Candidatus Aquicultorales bacterium]
MVKIALVDPDPQFADEIQHALEERSDLTVAAVAFDLNRALALAETGEIQVMIIGPGISTDISIPFVKRMTGEHPIGVLVLASRCTQRLKAAALRANVVEVLEVPASSVDIIAGIAMAAGFAGQLAVEPPTPLEKEREATVITVFSTKGGVGKTVISSNMAVSIAKQTEARVALVDLDLQFGDSGIALGLSCDQTIADMADGAGGISDELLKKAFARHESGVCVLQAPVKPEAADLVSPEMTRAVLRALKSRFDFIVVDTPAAFNDHVLTALDLSDEICLILTMDILSLKNLKLCLRTLNDLRYPREKQRVVINRIEGNVGLRVPEVEKALGFSAIGRIPADSAVPLSLNKGIPVVLDAPKLPVGKAISDLGLYYASKYLPEWDAAVLTG